MIATSPLRFITTKSPSLFTTVFRLMNFRIRHSAPREWSALRGGLPFHQCETYAS